MGDLHRRRQRGRNVPPLWRHPFSWRRPGWETAGALRRHGSLAEGATLLRRHSRSTNPVGDRERLCSLVHDRSSSLISVATSRGHSPEIFLSSVINFRSARLILVW